MTQKIAILPGDGIGPEIIAEAVKVLHALNLDLQAAAYFAHADDLRQLDDEHLGWMARSAMRTGNWPQVRRAIEAMSPLAQREPVWKYWLARSLQNGQQRPAQRSRKAETLLQQIAGHQGFYELLALEELRGHIDAAQPVRNPDAQELAAARACGLVMTLPEVMTDAMEQLGIDLPGYVPGRPYEMSMPASFLIDSKGKIIYSFVDEDFRHRAEPEALLSALQLLQPGN